MAWKNEKRTIRYNIERVNSDILYYIIRQYCQIDDITRREREDGRISFYVNVKYKNTNRLQHDVQIMKRCGINVLEGA